MHSMCVRSRLLAIYEGILLNYRDNAMISVDDMFFPNAVQRRVRFSYCTGCLERASREIVKHEVAPRALERARTDLLVRRKVSVSDVSGELKRGSDEVAERVCLRMAGGLRRREGTRVGRLGVL